jgi:hypothetical protein
MLVIFKRMFVILSGAQRSRRICISTLPYPQFLGFPPLHAFPGPKSGTWGTQYWHNSKLLKSSG